MLISKIMKKFTEISIKACKENMCWNLTCTTCGSIDLMFAFTKAVFPNAKKGLNRFSWNNPISYQEKMLDFFAKEIDISELHTNSCFPDWLGHIGLLLSSCEKAEKESHRLSKVLLPQFKKIIEKDKHVVSKIEYMIEHDHLLTTSFLEDIENSLKKHE